MNNYDDIDYEFFTKKDKILFNLTNHSRDASNRIIKIFFLRLSIFYFYKYKRQCKYRGVEYYIYFSKEWEHCHNSKNKDFCFITSYEKELESLLQKTH